MSFSSNKVQLRILLRNTWAAQKVSSWIRLVDTQSMSPSLSGDLFLFVAWTTTLNFEPGELILFHLDELRLPVVHRTCSIRTIEDKVSVLQIADQFNEFGSSWVPLKTVLGRITAIRWGEPGAKVTKLNHWQIRYLGRLIANLSTRRLEHMNQLGIRRENGSRHLNLVGRLSVVLILRILHKSLCYIYALLLRVKAEYPKEFCMGEGATLIDERENFFNE